MAVNLGSNFYPKLVEMCSRSGIKPEDLLNIMVSESGIGRNQGKGDSAAGLIQFILPTLKGMGYQGTQEDFRHLSGEEQIPYIEKFIKNKGMKFNSAAQYYVANFWPVALNLPGIKKEDPGTIFVEENPERVGKYSKKYYDIGYKIPASQEIDAYKSNPLFHKTVPGAITYGDMIKQTEENKRNPIYQQAIAAMQNATSYKPDKTQIAYKTKSELPQESQTTVGKKEISSSPMTKYFESLIDHFLKMFAGEVSLKKLYKYALPNHNILIQIDAPDYTSAVEFSRILCCALDEDLLSTSYPHTDGQKVEVECSIQGPEYECFTAVNQMSSAIAEVFKEATIKIGSVDIKVNCVMHKKSSYQ